MRKKHPQMRDADYYLAQRYPVEVRELSPEEGGGFMATIPQLGRHTFVGDGETAEEALASLRELREHLIPELVRKGVVLPEPELDEVATEQYSGNLMTRIPKSLHASIAAQARRNGCSINKLVTQLLASSVERTSIIDELRRELRDEVRRALGEQRREASGRGVRTSKPGQSVAR